ncbi:hypothetical protein D3C80_831170 [compost metagenome]
MTSPSAVVRLMSRPEIIPPALLMMLSPANRSTRLPAWIRPLLTILLPAMAERLLVARRVPTLSRSPPAIRLTSCPATSAPLGARRLLALAR